MKVSLFIAALVGTLTACGQAHSGSRTSEFVVGGNSTSYNTDSNSKLVRVLQNAAVLDTTGGQFGDSWGVGQTSFDASFVPGNGSGGLDETAAYVYLYQIASTQDSQASVGTESIELFVPLGDITSYGFFRNWGFQDAQGQVSSTNAFGSDIYVNVSVADLPSNVPFMGGVSKPAIINIAGGSDPGQNPSQINIGPGHFDQVWGTDNPLAPGQRGVIAGFTSNDPPGNGAGQITPGQ